MADRSERLGLRHEVPRLKRRRGSLTALLFAILALAALAWALRPDRPAQNPGARRSPAPVMPASERYTYGEAEFSRFIRESRGGWASGPKTFYGWMDAQMPRTSAAGPPPAAWGPWMDDKRRALDAITDPARKAAAQRDLCATVHRRVKLAIPRFSLDRGFEFQHTVTHGERQCFLQSVLVAGLLQRAGVDAGVVMIFRNPKGQESNNGHAVTLARFADGRAALVDASEQRPFAAHTGVFAWDAGARDYRFLQPVYTNSTSIAHFSTAGSSKRLPVSSVRPLPLDFLRSQFEYYRGERAPGGLVAKNPTPAGLKASARHLRASVQLCPENPLPRYMLMRAHDRLGDAKSRDREAATARRLYDHYGWTPDGFPE